MGKHGGYGLHNWLTKGRAVSHELSAISDLYWLVGAQAEPAIDSRAAASSPTDSIDGAAAD